jgi:hypothetical protein
MLVVDRLGDRVVREPLSVPTLAKLRVLLHAKLVDFLLVSLDSYQSLEDTPQGFNVRSGSLVSSPGIGGRLKLFFCEDLMHVESLSVGVSHKDDSSDVPLPRNVERCCQNDPIRSPSSMILTYMDNFSMSDNIRNRCKSGRFPATAAVQP